MPEPSDQDPIPTNHCFPGLVFLAIGYGKKYWIQRILDYNERYAKQKSINTNLKYRRKFGVFILNIIKPSKLVLKHGFLNMQGKTKV